MNSIQNRIVLLVTSLVLVLHLPALADWETDVRIQGLGTKATGKFETGKAYMKGSKLRMDTTSEREGNMTILFNHDAKIMTTLQHASKAAIQMNMADLGSLAKGKEKDLMTNCNPKAGATRCLQQMGYKKSGSEKVNGFDCEIYETSSNDESEKHRTRLWHPRGMEEVPAVRVVRTDASGQLIQQIDFVNLKTKSLSDALFEVPAGYKKQDMGAMMKGFGEMFKKMGETAADPAGGKKARKGKLPGGAAHSMDGAFSNGQMPQLTDEQKKQMQDAMSEFKRAMEEAQKNQESE